MAARKHSIPDRFKCRHKKAVRCSVDMPMTVSTHMSLTYTNVYPQVDL